MSSPNLLTYSDYRAYLRDVYQSRKAADADFSFRYLSLRAGINSSGFYKHVIDGKRNLTKSSLLKTCLALRLQDREAEYFENLVFFNQAKTLREKNLYFDRLTRLRGQYETRAVSRDQLEFYSEWHHSAVRELLACKPFTNDVDALARRLEPPVSAAEVRRSLALMQRLGLVKKDSRGRWSAVDPVLVSPGSVAEVEAFQRRMLRLAAEAFERFPGPERLMSSTTFSLSKETLETFKRRIRELKAEFLELARKDEEADRVYQLNLNLFPLARTPGDPS